MRSKYRVQNKERSRFLPFTAQFFAIQLINSIICISVVIKFLRRLKPKELESK